MKAARPRDDSFEQLGFHRREAIQWLAPLELLDQQRHELVAGKVAPFTDRRETLAALDDGPIEPTFDLSGRDDVWVDYLSDTGDGFGATYTMAWLLARDRLAVEGLDGDTPAGSLLVMGGDESYPVASDTAYRDRLVGPFGAALPCRPDGARALAAIPGNHDWYDGLGAWTRRFCQGSWIGGWRTAQRRSYFSARLPHDWWIWGVDIGLEELVDLPQLRYFDALARRAAELAGDRRPRLVICTSKPSWLEAVPGADHGEVEDAALGHLHHRVAARHGLDVVALVSGDDHFYARHESERGPMRFTCGGGGAFLRPTDHVPAELEIPAGDRSGPSEHARLRAVYPTAARSRRLRWRALWFAWKNRGFPLVPAVAYLAWLLPLPGRLAALAALGGALMGLTRVTGLGRRAMWGLPHLGSHTAAMAATAALVGRADVDGAAGAWLHAAALFAAGAVVGSLLMGLYFVVAGRLAGVNDNETFSAIRVQDHKAWLRLHVGTDGTLVVHPIAVDAVVATGDWQVVPDGAAEEPWFAPRPGVDLPTARLIEPPVRLGPAG